MKREKKNFIMVELALLFILVMVTILTFKDQTFKKDMVVSVILQNSEDKQWLAFKYGVEAAAKKYGMDVTYTSTNNGNFEQEENNRIEQELKLGANAIIIQPVGDIYSPQSLKTIKKKVPIVLVNSEGRDNHGGFTSISGSNYEMGFSLGEEISKDFSEHLEKMKIGIISTTRDEKQREDRKDGLKDALKETSGEICWEIHEEACNLEEEIGKSSVVDIVVAMDDISMNYAGNFYSVEKPGQVLLYGIGNTEKAIYYLDTRVSECLIIPDAFTMGYQSMEEIQRQFKFGSYQTVNKTVGYDVIRREDLFSEEVQELLYMIGQSK